jgi:hypothetical protein
MPLSSFAQSSNIGIIKGIWFSEDIYFAQDPIRIYTAIQNNSGNDIQGSVEFFDNDISIGTKNFTALNGRIAEVWIDSLVTQGKHNYSVAITEAQINKPGEAPETITPSVIRSDDVIVVDIDTDGDNIGDEIDDDDDNDGFTDDDEEQQGTDPLDSQEYPKEEDSLEEKSSQLEETLDDLLNLFGSSDEKEDSDEMVTEEEITKEDSRIESPLFVQNLEQQYPVVEKITEPLNSIQNNIVPKIKQEQQRINKKHTTVESFEDPVVLNEDGTLQKESRGNLPGWMYALYLGILQVSTWFFSCIVCLIVGLFLILHLVLKIIFRFFRNRVGYIKS